MPYVVTCNGNINLDGGTEDLKDISCNTNWQIELLPVIPVDDGTGGGGGGGTGTGEPFTLDAVEAASFVGTGFFVILPLWAALYGGRMILNALGR